MTTLSSAVPSHSQQQPMILLGNISPNLQPVPQQTTPFKSDVISALLLQSYNLCTTKTSVATAAPVGGSQTNAPVSRNVPVSNNPGNSVMRDTNMDDNTDNVEGIARKKRMTKHRWDDKYTSEIELIIVHPDIEKSENSRRDRRWSTVSIIQVCWKKKREYSKVEKVLYEIETSIIEKGKCLSVKLLLAVAFPSYKTVSKAFESKACLYYSLWLLSHNFDLSWSCYSLFGPQRR